MNDDQYVSYWNGAEWAETHVGKDLSGIWGFSSSDVWVSGETVLHFDGNGWTDMGGGGPTIWGPSSGDMWTGNGAHLENGSWVPHVGAGTGFDLVTGKSASSVFFKGIGANALNYFFDGKTFAPSLGNSNAFDVAASDRLGYWFVGPADDNGQGNLLLGGPTGALTPPSYGYTTTGPEPDPLYKVAVDTVFQKVGSGWIPIKTFDAAATGDKALAFRNANIWVCVGGRIQQYDGERWTEIASGCEVLQTDAEGRLWVLQRGAGADRVRVFDGRAWQELPTPPGFAVRDLAVRFKEAWLLGTTTALRRSGDHWDEYALGVDRKHAPKRVTIDAYGVVFFDSPQLYFPGSTL